MMLHDDLLDEDVDSAMTLPILSISSFASFSLAIRPAVGKDYSCIPAILDAINFCRFQKLKLTIM